MKKTTIVIAAMCALLCASAVGCNGDNDKTRTRNDTSVTPQEQLKTQDPNSSKSDYVQVSIDDMSVTQTGWIKLPQGTEYLILLNDPDESFVNGYAYPDQPAEVYKEEGNWLLVKTRDKVGYIPKENFTTEEPATGATTESSTNK